MGFGDLKKEAGLRALHDYLADRSYIEGYTVSQADVVVFEALSGAPGTDLYNALRWYNQVKSYKSQFSSLPGIKKSLGEYGPATAAKPAAQNAAADDDDDDDDVDLFGSDDDDDEALKALQASRKAADDAAPKKKAPPVAKSSIVLFVKPWDDETDMKEVETLVRSIEMDGLLWGSSKLVPVGYGINKLQIGCVVEDDKVGTDDLEEKITAFEDHVQSVDIAAFNKI
ncbi:elongation factor 1-beta-like [Acanthaster planci]|uniref:Elongation factor 1-beta n=1 Tax=Acanthaster planci TaxID=133434 RepID=A0A8B7ZWP0_ACAPL|nr:elongation factor 1-beta-like [Acanthaster planci]